MGRDSSSDYGNEDLLELATCDLLELGYAVLEMMFAYTGLESDQPLIKLISCHDVYGPFEWVIEKKLMPLVQGIGSEEV